MAMILIIQLHFWCNSIVIGCKIIDESCVLVQANSGLSNYKKVHVVICPPSPCIDIRWSAP